MLSLFPELDGATRGGVALFLELDALTDPQLAHWQLRLSAAERCRAAGFGSPGRARAFIAARYLLRAFVFERLGLEPDVEVSPTGAPVLAVLGRSIPCTISHSAGAILVGYNPAGTIGGDIEHRRPRAIGPLVETYFHDDERDCFLQLAEGDRLPWFYDQWCRKEALAKLDGEGLSLASLANRVRPSPGTELITLPLSSHSAAVAYRGGVEPGIFRFRPPDRFQPTETSSHVSTSLPTF